MIYDCEFPSVQTYDNELTQKSFKNSNELVHYKFVLAATV